MKKEYIRFIQTLVEYATKNDLFRDELISNPVSTMNSFAEGKFKFPESMKVIVLKNNPSIVYLDLPRKIDIDDSYELTPEELELVAGGGVPKGLIVAGVLSGMVCTAGYGIAWYLDPCN